MSAILEIKNLKKTYQSGNIALKGINLSIKKGDCFALLGPNGAGKSTTIGIICTLVNKSSGKIFILNHDLDTHSTTIKLNLGLVPQEFNANRFEKVRDILITQAGYYGISYKKIQDRVNYYLEKLGLKDKQNIQSGALSGGMKRRLLIARAMIHDPDIIILDEPTAGVDIELRHGLWDFIRSINKSGKTIILTTHYLEEAERLCNNIAIINNGKIAHQGSMHKLLEAVDTEKIILTSKDKIATIPTVENYQIKQINEHSLEVSFRSDLGLNLLFNKLSELNIKIHNVTNVMNKIEQLYMRIINEKQPISQ